MAEAGTQKIKLQLSPEAEKYCRPDAPVEARRAAVRALALLPADSKLGERLPDRRLPHSGGNSARPQSGHSVSVGAIDAPQAGQSSALISDWPKSSGTSGIWCPV